MSRLVAALLACAAIACTADSGIAPLPASELRRAPLEIAVDNEVIALATELWRDFAPISPAGGRPLTGVLRFQREDGSVVSGVARAEAAWIVNGDDVWTTEIREERFPSPGQSFYEAVIRDGPKWAPGTLVDVVVRVRNSRGQAFLLRATDQRIGRTD